MNEPLGWLDGRFVPEAQMAVPVWDQGFMLGATVSEQLRTFGGKLFEPEWHWDRLARSLAAVQPKAEFPRQQLDEAAHELIERNHALLMHGDDLGLSVFVTPGAHPSFSLDRPKLTDALEHLKSTDSLDTVELVMELEEEFDIRIPDDVAENIKTVEQARGFIKQQLPGDGRARPLIGMHTYPLPFARFSRQYANGAELVESTVRQVPAECWPPELKCRSRMHYYLAQQQAEVASCGAYPVLPDLSGHWTETPTANVLLVMADKRLIGPPHATILPGVTLHVVEELAATLKLSVSQQSIDSAFAATASEILLTSTPFVLLPVTQLNGKPIGDGRPGPVYRLIRDAFAAQVKCDFVAQAARFAVGE